MQKHSSGSEKCKGHPTPDLVRQTQAGVAMIKLLAQTLPRFMTRKTRAQRGMWAQTAAVQIGQIRSGGQGKAKMGG